MNAFDTVLHTPEALLERERLLNNVIEARMELYNLFPEKITEISKIFQKWGFG